MGKLVPQETPSGFSAHSFFTTLKTQSELRNWKYSRKGTKIVCRQQSAKRLQRGMQENGQKN